MRLLLLAAAAFGLAGCDWLLWPGGGEADKDERLPEEKPSGDEKAALESRDVKPDQLVAEKDEAVDPLEEGLVPKRDLGRTGCRVSIIGLGGSFLLSRANRAEEAEVLIEQAVEAGINYIDTAPSYGVSEINIGRVMPRLREKVFLASKTIDRTYDGTMRLFEQSLKRLQTDYLDLLQLHGIHEWNDLERVFAPRGAFAALEQLKAEKVVRFTGITGHKNPAVINKAIADYDFDCLLFAMNAADTHDRAQSFQYQLLPTARGNNMGIIAMKVASYGRIFRAGGLETMQDALAYVLSFPVSSAIIGISNLSELEENIELAGTFKPLFTSALKELEMLVEPYHREATFYRTAW